MSRKGKQPITIPKGVEVNVANNIVTVKGPKGQLTLNFLNGINVSIKDDQAMVSYREDKKELMPFQGLYRTLISNMIEGTVTPFSKALEMKGVGYRAAVQGQQLNLQIGTSHPVLLDIPEGITVTVEKNTLLTVSGVDKQLVGQYAAFVRSKRPPEPYQGKGIRYKDEHVRRKSGKKA